MRCPLDCMNCSHATIADEKEGLELLVKTDEDYQAQFMSQYKQNSSKTVLVCTKGKHKNQPVLNAYCCENHSESDEYELKRQIIIEKLSSLKLNGVLFEDAINCLQEDEDIDKDILQEVLEEAMQYAIKKGK